MWFGGALGGLGSLSRAWGVSESRGSKPKIPDTLFGDLAIVREFLREPK